MTRLCGNKSPRLFRCDTVVFFKTNLTESKLYDLGLCCNLCLLVWSLAILTSARKAGVRVEI
jgi:hypothetical protein